MANAFDTDVYFGRLSSDSHLLELKTDDRKLLLSFLVLADQAQTMDREELAALMFGVRETAKHTAVLLATLNAHKNDLLLRIAIPAISLLAWFLQRTLNRLEKHLSVAARPGQERKALQTAFLVQASEFVKSRLGSYCDTEVTRLCDLVGESSSSGSRDVTSIDSLRKRRAEMRSSNRTQYDWLISLLPK